MQKSVQENFIPFDAKDWKLGVVVARFNRHITDVLYQSALTRAQEYQIQSDSIRTIKVAGAIEIPLVLAQMARSGQFNALLALGCVIKGATPHFEYVASFVTDGVLRVQLDNNMPVGFGILTCDTEAQALERSELGGDFLDAVLHQTKALMAFASK